jgi:DNA-binding SARP family transcriptional activator
MAVSEPASQDMGPDGVRKRCRVELLGGLRVTVAGRHVERLRAQKGWRLLAYLAYHLDAVHTREKLADLFWHDKAAPGQNLRQALVGLRRLLEPPGTPPGSVLTADRRSVRLHGDQFSTDVLEFEAALAAAGRATSPLDRIERLEQAVARYRGELLVGQEETWVLPERERLAERHMAALRELVRLLEERHETARALAYARQAVAADPLREEACRDLMRLLAATGQTGAALYQYRRLRERLLRELKARPGGETVTLARALRSGALPTVVAPGATRHAPRPNLEPGAASAAGAPALDAQGVSRYTVTLLMVESLPGVPRERPSAGEADPATRRWRDEWTARGGALLGEEPGALLLAFTRAGDAAACAAGALAAEGEGLRLALHTGAVAAGDSGATSPAVRHVRRLLLAANPGQALCSAVTAALLRSDDEGAEPGVALIDLGLFRLRGNGAILTPEPLFQIGSGESARDRPMRPRALPARPETLPRPRTRFFGREMEIERLVKWLTAPRGEPPRLVTVTGTAGSGKTRLAIETVWRLSPEHREATCFLSLAPLTQPEAIVEAVAQSLGLTPSPGSDRLDQIARALRESPGILVLDSFEHLFPEGAPLVAALLERAPELLCLVTSRRALRLPGEQELPLPPLPAPEVPAMPSGASGRPGRAMPAGEWERLAGRLLECPSVRLFIDRAQSALPEFQLTPANADAVAALCCRLDGLPLAIELAAARMPALSPAQILKRLEDRFALLASRERGGERHRTLWTAIDGSYQALAPPL